MRTLRLVAFSLSALLLVACEPAEPPEQAAQEAAPAPAEALHALFEKEWQARLEASPMLATYVGVEGYDHRLPSVAPEDHAARLDDTRGFLTELHAIDRTALSTEERINYDIFERQLESRIASIEFRDYEMPITAEGGFHSGFARLPDQMGFRDADDFEDYIARLGAFPAYMDQNIANMRAGLERGFTPPRVTLEGFEDSIESLITDEASDSVFWAPFEDMPGSLPEAERERLAAEARSTIDGAVMPAYERFLAFMTEEYIPGTRTSIGAHELPDGEAYYRQQIREYTTLDMSPQEIHEIGLMQVDEILDQMQAVIDEVGFDGDLQAFIEYLRTDERFYADTPEELLKEAAWIAKTMDGKLPQLFGLLPRKPYTVEPVPREIAPKYTVGRYVPPPEGSTRPGIYWVNTYALETRPLYNMVALTLHEAVPGHHLQGSLAREQGDQPPFRRYSYISAFGEGWGLYSEYLGKEVGMYEDPYDEFGRLTYAMWRACRLVVDTGMHAMGWSRQEAMDFMAEHTALSMHEITTETDRYITWPGQALSYKLGELKIRELRAEAEERLGADFDVRDFHDALLANGSVPLSVLEEVMRDWIAQQEQEAQTSGG